jgi:hypothetical protein
LCKRCRSSGSSIRSLGQCEGPSTADEQGPDQC